MARAVVELPPSPKATLPPLAAPVQVDVGSVAETANGVADSSPEVLLSGVGSVMVVTPSTDTGARVWEPWTVLEALSVTVTLAGMLFTPMVSRPRP